MLVIRVLVSWSERDDRSASQLRGVFSKGKAWGVVLGVNVTARAGRDHRELGQTRSASRRYVGAPRSEVIPPRIHHRKGVPLA